MATIPGRVTVGDIDQRYTVPVEIDPPEPGGHVVGITVPVDLGIIADRIVVEADAQDLLAVLVDWERGQR